MTRGDRAWSLDLPIHWAALLLAYRYEILTVWNATWQFEYGSALLHSTCIVMLVEEHTVGSFDRMRAFVCMVYDAGYHQQLSFSCYDSWWYLIARRYGLWADSPTPRTGGMCMLVMLTSVISLLGRHSANIQ